MKMDRYSKKPPLLHADCDFLSLALIDKRLKLI